MDIFPNYKGGSLLPKDVWGVILKHLHTFDVVFARATSSTLYKLCKEYRPFPKYFVLDQDKCMDYLVENGSISGLDYVKNTLGFVWTRRLCSIAARSGQVEVLKHLTGHAVKYDPKTILLECSICTCDLNMIKFLHELGAPWDQNYNLLQITSSSDKIFLEKHQSAESTPIANMAIHGHLECMKYAFENGCSHRELRYTPSIACFDYALENGFDWKSDLETLQSYKNKSYNVCAMAARVGDSAMLKHAHQNGVSLNQSVSKAAMAGHFECLKYAFENSPVEDTYDRVKSLIGSKACFEYLVNKLGKNTILQRESARDLWLGPLLIGDVETLRYLLQNFPIPTERNNLEIMWQTATRSFEKFKFLLDEARLPLPAGINIYLCCAQLHNLEAFRLALERKFPNFPEANDRIMEHAIASANIDLVALAYENFPNKEGFTAKLISTAVTYSTPEILDFMAQRGVRWSSIRIPKPLQISNLPNLAYLIRSGYQWDNWGSVLCEKYTAANTVTVELNLLHSVAAIF